MKNSIRSFVIVLLLACTALSLVQCTKGGDQETLTGPVYTVTGNADGTQVVPASGLTATGSISGILDQQANVFTFTLSWTNLWTTAAPDVITGVKFYSPAAKGANGTLTHAINFTNSTSLTGSINLGLGGSIGFTSTERNDLYSGAAYYVIVTQKYPNGAIRGQLNAARQ